MYTWDKIITNELINKINNFFKKYDISKNCDDINEGIHIQNSIVQTHRQPSSFSCRNVHFQI